jgi:hypothetical protein
MSHRHHGHAPSFAGYTVVDWTPEMTELENPTRTAYALRLGWEDYDSDKKWIDYFKQFINIKDVEQIPAFIIGAWEFGSSEGIDQIVEIVAAHRHKLPNLKALFVGDITSEENEISWIQQGDLSPLLNAFPTLEHLAIRGGTGLQLGSIDMPKLKSLRIESGGLPREVVTSVGKANLPEVEKVVLWLGTANYGANTQIGDLQPFYECKTMPKLKYLGLCDSDLANHIATFMATAPVLERLETLDLSMGVMTDNGALALVKSPKIRNLKHLDLHHNFFSPEMIAKLKELEKDGLTLDLSENHGDTAEWRFVAVGE